MSSHYWVKASCGEDCGFEIQATLHYIKQFPNHCPKHTSVPFKVQLVTRNAEDAEKLAQVLEDDDQLHNED